MKNISTRKRSLATLARIARRRLVVRVRPLALAAAVALGAHGPSVFAQTVITPLQGAGQTATVVSTQGNQTTVSTQSLRDGNAFSTYSSFQVGQGDVVKLAVPQGATTWLVVGLVVTMAATIQLYARKRRLDREKLALSQDSPQVP